MNLSEHTPLPWRAGYRNSDIGCENVKLGGYVKLMDVRGWGYLTGMGHGGLGLPHEEAAKIQEDFTAFVIKAVNSHDALFAQNQWLKDRLSFLQNPSASRKSTEEWLVECGMPPLPEEIAHAG